MSAGWFRTPLSIAMVGLRRLSRDRVGLFFTFLLPLMIIVLLGAAIPGNAMTIGIVDADRGALSTALIEDLHTTRGLAIHRYDSVDALRKAVRREQVNGGLVVPDGYDADLRGDASVTVTLYVDQTSESATALRTAVVVDVRSTEAKGYQSLTVAQYATAGELVLFIFLIALVGAGEIVDTRRLGISRRILVSPATARQVIVGEGLNRFLTAGLQAGVITAATALMYQLSWGNPIGVILVVGAFAMVSLGAGLLMGTIARTNEQATSIGPIVGISMGMLGGCMWPLEVVPSQLRAVGHLTPHAWALDALIRLMGEGRGPADVLGPVAMLIAFAAVLVPVAAWRLNRSIIT